MRGITLPSEITPLTDYTTENTPCDSDMCVCVCAQLESMWTMAQQIEEPTHDHRAKLIDR